jgi:hypothetical protein
MVSLRIREMFLSPFVKNMAIDMSSTSGIMFLLLQNRWINSQRDPPFFWMTLARFWLTPRHVHVAWILLVNSQCRWFQERTDHAGGPRSQVLDDADR